MCMINLPIDSVSKTRILVALAKSKEGVGYQLTSYGNNIKLMFGVSTNAMVLAVPCPAVDIVVPDDSSLWAEETMDKLWRAFRDVSNGERGHSYGGTWGTTFGSSEPLPVFQSGSYSYSIAASPLELARTDPSVFTLNPRLGEHMAKLYSTGYSFIILTMARDGKYHPFTYTNKTQGDKAFIPLQHYHEHDAFKGSESTYGDYDHEIYLINTKRPEIINSSLTPGWFPPLGKFKDHNDASVMDTCAKALRPHLPDGCDVGFEVSSVVQWMIEGNHINCDATASKVDVLMKAQAVVWPRVSCDQCRKLPLTGPRFKCLLCPNIDVCLKCFIKPGVIHGHSASHPMTAWSDPAAFKL